MILRVGLLVCLALTSVGVAFGQAKKPAPEAPACCKACTKGCPCGDSCISCDKACHKAPGCACKR